MQRGGGGRGGSAPSPQGSAPGTPPGRSGAQPWFLAAGLAATGIGLGLFVLFSAGSGVARRGFGGSTGWTPPVYGILRPSFTALGLLAIGLAGLMVLISSRWTQPGKPGPALLLATGVAFMAAFSTATAFVGGTQEDEPLAGLRQPGQAADVALVEKFGVRDFVSEFPALVPRLRSTNDQTHPPGRLVILHLLHRAWPNRLVPRAVVLATASALMLVPTWFLAFEVAGDRAARHAVFLLATAPAPVLLSFVSLEAIEAAPLAAAAALLVIGIRNANRWPLALAGGFVLGLASFLTYAVGFVALFGVLLALGSRSRKDAARILGLALLGGLIALITLRLLAGYDLFASYAAYRDPLRERIALRVATGRDRPYAYWLFGGPAGWLIFAGLPIATLALRELLVERPRYLVALLAPLAAYYALPAQVSLLIPGELERTLLFTYPVAACAAGAALSRWERGSGPSRSRALAALVGVAAAQTIVLESLYVMRW